MIAEVTAVGVVLSLTLMATRSPLNSRSTQLARLHVSIVILTCRSPKWIMGQKSMYLRIGGILRLAHRGH